ncbi:hypothetical protein MLD38_014291 [Melastoma candidum]|uniref:Uncharacterized protein n=1 Tax=Melastoma candidum TaxID=119954 RepID=A0ACB9RBX5_9MYRT|nr:hypothetical protein MLD38_014291 [Melastoma candidum]
MEAWAPLFDIFLRSPTPETDASRWLKESGAGSAEHPLSTSSFVSLLGRPLDVVVLDPLPQRSRVMFMSTLPSFVQSRILWFLGYEHRRFDLEELSRLGARVLSGHGKVDFWVESAARHLVDLVSSVREPERVSRTRLAGKGDGLCQEFESVPVWLKCAASNDSVLFPLVTVAEEVLSSDESDDFCGDVEMSGQVIVEEDEIYVAEEIEVDFPVKCSLGPEILSNVADLKARLINCNSASMGIELSKEIKGLCQRKDLDSFQILELLEPWKADDETASVLLSHLTDITQDELVCPSQVLCSVMLPKLLALENAVSRVLLAVILDCCKLHQRATEYALLFPLMMRKEGINGPICDVVSKIMKACLHPTHISAFLEKLLCSDRNELKFICLSSQRSLISTELVWTESLFNLLHNVLNHNVHLTQDSVDHIVPAIQRTSQRLSKSLKFGHFLLCLISKCPLEVKPHKDFLIKVAESTDTLVTKSILTKLVSL